MLFVANLAVCRVAAAAAAPQLLQEHTKLHTMYQIKACRQQYTPCQKGAQAWLPSCALSSPIKLRSSSSSSSSSSSTGLFVGLYYHSAGHHSLQTCADNSMMHATQLTSHAVMCLWEAPDMLWLPMAGRNRAHASTRTSRVCDLSGAKQNPYHCLQQHCILAAQQCCKLAPGDSPAHASYLPSGCCMTSLNAARCCSCCCSRGTPGTNPPCTTIRLYLQIAGSSTDSSSAHCWYLKA
jgi:hypothetical protein